MKLVDWFAVTSLCWLPIMIGCIGSYGLARMLDALGLIEEEE